MKIEDLGTFKLKDKPTRNVLIDLRKTKYPIEKLREIFIGKITGENNKVRIVAYWDIDE